MGTSWTAFAVRSDARDAIFDACSSAVVGLRGVKEPTLILGEAHPSGFAPFVIEFVGFRYTEMLDHTEFEPAFAEGLQRALGAELWALMGDSNTDICTVEHYEGGRRIRSEQGIRGRLSRWSRLSGFDLDALARWAHFGISGAEPAGTRYSFGG